MGASFELGTIDVATVGTVGAPGQRVFYLQFRTGSAVVSVRMEKQQVAALAEYMAELLADLPPPDALPDPGVLELAEPVEAVWVAGSLGLAADVEADVLVLLVEEAVPVDEEGEPDPDAVADQGRLTARLSRAQAVAMVARGRDLVEAGRPACPICGRPMDPDGHICPRSNGHGVH